jgi:hypothetical protein
MKERSGAEMKKKRKARQAATVENFFCLKTESERERETTAAAADDETLAFSN